MSTIASPRSTRFGLAAALFAYFCWGFLPLYWRPIQQVPALEILAHRIAWSMGFLVVLLTARRQWAWLGPALRRPRVLGVFALSAALLSMNWFLYIWAVNAGQVVEASLGYFINPMVNLLLGRLVLKERLRGAQLLAVGLAFAGVAWLTLSLGAPPWISLTLAISFGLYGLLRKVAPLGSLEGLTLETLIMAVPAVAFLAWREWATVERGHFGHDGLFTTSMLLAAGVVTAVPLLAFATAARTLPLSVMGVVQYLSPTLQFLIGVLVFHEPFARSKLVGFGFIWAALLIFGLEGLWVGRRQRAP